MDGKISVVIHTYNSEKFIRDCLESVKNFDEIVICDMYSTDKTVEIANEYNCKVVYHELTGWAEPARNFAISQATNDWILVVDSDETITEELRKYLYEFIKNPTHNTAIRIPRLNYCWGEPLEIPFERKIHFNRNGNPDYYRYESPVLGENQYFCMGDNYTVSADCYSETKSTGNFSPIYLENIQGVLIAIEGICKINNVSGEGVGILDTFSNYVRKPYKTPIYYI
jgi:glycosyltransferase involved in cell wall biosynthesis